MKKLAGVFTALATLAMVFTGCDDMNAVKVDPNAMEGNWFYYELDTSEAEEETIKIIFSSPTDGTQTADIADVPTTGTLYYVWASSAGKVLPTISERTDNPDKKLDGENKLALYVFTNASDVSLWAWDSEVNLTGGEWPGLAMETDAVIEVEKEEVSFEISVTGLPDEVEGETVYFTGDFNSWKTPGKEDTYDATVTDGAISGVIVKYEAKKADSYSVSGKFAAADWGKPEIAGEENAEGKADNASFTVKASGSKVKATFVKLLGDEGEGYVCVCNWTVD